jgi:hypothetical protein
MKKFNEEQSLSREKVFGDARTIVRVKDSTLGGKLQGEGLKLRPSRRRKNLMRMEAARTSMDAPGLMVDRQAICKLHLAFILALC